VTTSLVLRAYETTPVGSGPDPALRVMH
jgi:hypothetical protein